MNLMMKFDDINETNAFLDEKCTQAFLLLSIPWSDQRDDDDDDDEDSGKDDEEASFRQSMGETIV